MNVTSTALQEARGKAAIWETRARDIKARYDVLEGNRLRRRPRRETTGESGQYAMPARLDGVNIGRDLERNYAPAKGILQQFRMNVVGSLGKLEVNAENGEEAAAWFNEVFARDPDYRDTTHWSTLCQNVVASAFRDGDVLMVFDDELIEDSGKLLSWESDQIVPVTDSVLAALGLAGERHAPNMQDNGIIRTQRGKIIAYLTTGQHGRTVVDEIANITPWKPDQARLIKNPWRLNQGRGVPRLITAASSLLDLYEMLGRELQSAKRAAAQYAWVNRKNAVDDWDSPGTRPEVLPENDGKTASTVAEDGANSASAPEARNYEELEAWLGGQVDYGEDGDSVIFAPPERPNVHMPEFIEAVQCQAGAAFGLARAYSMLRADSSYTAFRGDMIMSWQGAFYPAQKWLERDFADWAARKALAWAMKKKAIPTLAPGWERSISWLWPTMPEVDELDWANSVAQQLKNGTTDYSRLLGPDWRKRLKGFAEQVQLLRDLNIPAGVLELKSGGAVNPKKDAVESKGNA